MEIKKGTVVGWNNQTNSLIVISKDDQRRIEIEQSEFSIYEMLSPSGVPFELSFLMGKEIYFTQLENKKYSRKAVMSNTMSTLKIGDIFQATVISLPSRNAFLEYKGCFFHCGAKEISRSHVKSSAEYFRIGQKINVKLLSKDSSTQYPEVSYKQAYSDSLENYHTGDYCVAKVSHENTAMQAYFMEVTPVVPGLLDFRCCPRSILPLSHGDIVCCKVKNVSKSGLRLHGIYIVRRAK